MSRLAEEASEDIEGSEEEYEDELEMPEDPEADDVDQLYSD